MGESLPPEARPLLQKLGVWDAFLAEGHQSCLGSCSTWGSDEPGYNDFLFNPLGCGWHLDRRRFDAFLGSQAEAAGARLCTGTRFERCDGDDDGFLVELRDEDAGPSRVRARFVVDATGIRSAFARRAGARRRLFDGLVFVYGFFELPASASFPQLTTLEAVENGWWYAARLPEGRLAVAFAGDADWIRQEHLREPVSWLTHLATTRQLAASLAECRFLADSLLVSPAPSFQLDRSIGHRWLAVGDAAAAFDPISGQGIHKALATGLAAAESVAGFLAGDPTRLEEYGSAIEERFEGYRTIRDHFYGLERRWPGSLFWRRRRERAAEWLAP